MSSLVRPSGANELTVVNVLLQGLHAAYAGALAAQQAAVGAAGGSMDLEHAMNFLRTFA